MQFAKIKPTVLRFSQLDFPNGSVGGLTLALRDRIETGSTGDGHHKVLLGCARGAEPAIANDRTCRGRPPTARGHRLRRS